VIIQNPECVHVGDVIRYCLNNQTDSNYLSFSCYSIDRNDTTRFYGLAAGKLGIEIRRLLDSRDFFNDRRRWYNHPVFRPVGYHFLSSIILLR